MNYKTGFTVVSVVLAVSIIALSIISVLLTVKSNNYAPNNSNSLTSTVTSSTQAITTQNNQLKPWIQKFQTDAQNIVQSLTSGSNAGLGFTWLAKIVDTYGPRPENGKALNDTINYILQTTKQQGFDNVRPEPVVGIRNWIRGTERVTLLKPRIKDIRILGIGNSAPGNITADVIVVSNFDELDTIGNSSNNQIQGKIVVYNEPWKGTYAASYSYRIIGAQRAAKYGALAVLVRSVTSFSVYSPHTGAGSHSTIPMACLTVEDAMMLARMQKRGNRLRMNVFMTSHSESTVNSANTIFELQGTTYPEQIIAIGGHLDSWDVGQGAMDDGGGCAVMWQAATALLNLGLRPKRTIRVVFFTAEENGYSGAQQYYERHMNETHVFTVESDEGVFKPTSTNATIKFRGGTQNTASNLQQISYLIQSLGIPVSAKLTTEDIGEMDYFPANQINSTGSFYLNYDAYQKYFTFHHTNGDTMTVYKPEDLDYTAAIMAVYAHVVANMDIQL